MRVVITTLLLLLPAVASAQPGHEHGEHKPWKRGEFAKELNLTDEQRNKLKELHEARQKMKQSGDEMQAKREELGQLLRDKNVGEDEIRKRARELNEQQNKMAAERIENLLKMRRVLSAEQFGKFLDGMKERMQERMGEGHRGNGGGLRGR